MEVDGLWRPFTRTAAQLVKSSFKHLKPSSSKDRTKCWFAWPHTNFWVLILSIFFFQTKSEKRLVWDYCQQFWMHKPKQATFGHVFAFQTLRSVLCLWFPCMLPALGCCQLLCPPTSSPAAAHHGSQPAPAPVFFLMMLNEPGLGKARLEQHVLPLSACNGRPRPADGN